MARQIRGRWRPAVLALACLLLALAPPAALSSDPELTQADNDLFDALKGEDFDAAAAALGAGANINSRSDRGLQTPLMQNVLHGRLKSVEWCLKNGADATIPERDGYTPMHGAAFQGRVEIAELLKEHGVGLRDLHKDGHEPAIRTCWGPEERHAKALAWFLDNGVPLNDIYDTCMEMSSNPAVKELLQKRKGGDEL
ncbi:hypothetical protein ACHAWF_009076 [Thalassiosira exigua]